MEATTGKALKRRGLMAAAAALVAGIAAKQTSQPVAAAGLTLETTNTVVASTTTIKVGTTFQNTVFEVDATASTANVLYIDAIRGHGQFTGAGVHGYGGDAKPSTGAGLGLQGTGGNGGAQPGGLVRDGGRGAYAYGGSGGIGGDGVYAHGGSAGAAGLRGGYGVYAEAGAGEATSAVYAINRFQSSAGHVGVTGVCTSAAGIGVQGQITGSAANTYAVQGLNQSTGVGGIGVRGDSNQGTGVYGATTSGLYGVYGIAGSHQGAGGVVGVATVAGTIGFAGAAFAPATDAGYFTGNVSIFGNLGVSGSKFAVVKGSDGMYRGMYAVESPECWFEDVGEGTLTGGKASVKLDPLFAQHVHTDSYHVFLTPHDAEHHLAVPGRAGQGFSVQASPSADAAAKGKKAGDLSGTFSWRVMAKRNDIKGERLPVWQMPTPAFTTPESPAPAPTAPDVPPQPAPPSRPAQPAAAPQDTPPSPVQPAPPPRP